MALKIIKKDEKPAPKLPEGGDRFLWTEVPVAKKPEYVKILKGEKAT